MVDNFTDQNFDSNVAWGGSSAWENRTASEGGPNVASVNVIRVNPEGSSGTFYLSTGISTWHTAQEWIFWYGRRQSATSATNRMRFWLYSTQQNLNSGSASGYAIEIGDGSGAQEIRLVRIQNGSVTSTVITSANGINGSLNDYGLGIRVVRNDLGEWALFTSNIPTTNGAGLAPNGNILSETSVLQGSGTDNVISPSGLGFIGPAVTVPSLTNTAGRTSEFDNIYFTPCNARTEVQFVQTALSLQEGGASGTIQVTATNTNSNNPTTANLAITAGDGSLVTINPTSIVFPASLVINESFESFITSPSPDGLVYNSITHGANNPFLGSRTAVMNGNNDNIRTTLAENPGIFSFQYRRRNNITNSVILIQYSSSTSGPWTTVGDVSATSTNYAELSYDFTGLTNIFIRILHTRSGNTGEILIDNLKLAPASQPVTVTMIDDEFCSGNGSQLTLGITSVSGSYLPTIGTNSTCQINLFDNDQELLDFFSDNFEDGDASDWFTPVAGSFAASNQDAINGGFSIRHIDQGETTTGATSTSIPVPNVNLNGSVTRWRFNINTFNTDPNNSNFWIVCITNDQADIAFQTIDGYALAVLPSASGPDYLRFYFTISDFLFTLIDTPLAQGIDFSELGVEITRSETGVWELKVDTDGGFDNLVSQGTAFDDFWNDIGHFGAYYVYNTSTKGSFSMDDISISQSACEQTLYSQMTGASNAAIWASEPVGTPAIGNPGPFTRLVIQEGHNVTFSGSNQFRTLEIQNGATVNGGSASIALRGDLINDGTLSGGTSTIRFIGTDPQAITGTGTATFHNVEANNSAGVSLDVAANIKGQLRTQSGIFYTNNQLTLTSNITETGSIGTISPGADVIGQITMQRFVPLAPQYWVYLTNPLLNQTIQDWNDDITITGFPGSDFPNYNFNSFYHYDEVQPGGRNVGWVGATNANNPMDPKRGYIVYMNATAVNIDMTGDFQKGNVTVPLSHTDNEPGTGYFNPDGWNLVGNVYPCAVDWVALRNASTSWSGGNGTYYVYDAAGSNYRAYNGVSQAGTANRFIASGQGFFVQATANDQALEFNENVKATSSAAFQRNTEESTIVRFNFTRGNMDDEMVLTLRDDATLGFDEMYDGIKWESPVANAPEIAFVTPDESKLTIQTIGNFTEDIEMPVFVKMPQTGNYTFSVSQVQNLPLGVCLTVQDLVTGEIIPLEQGQTLVINNTAAYTGNRLMIRMTAPLNANVVDASCFEANDGSIVLSSAISSWTVLAEDAFGNTHYAENGAISNLPAGDYNVMLENSEALCVAQNIGLTVGEPEIVSSEVVNTVDRCNNSANANIEIIVSNVDLFEYVITNAAGEIVAQETVADSYKLISDLSAGLYSVAISSDCYNETINVNLNDPFAIALDLSISTPTLEMQVGETVYIQAEAIASNAIEYEWSVNGFDGGDQPYLNFAVNTAGVYNIQCVASTEGCSATAFTSAIVTEVQEEEEEEVLSTEELEEGNPYATVTRMGNSIVVSFFNAANGPAKIKLYNSVGQMVMTVNANVSSKQVRTIDITGLAAGMYIVHVEQNNSNLAKQQFIK